MQEDLGRTEMPDGLFDAEERRFTIRMFKALGLSPSDARTFVMAARANVSSVHAEMLADPDRDEAGYYRTLAALAELRFASELDPGRLVPLDQPLLELLGLPPNRLICLYRNQSGGTDLIVSPDLAQASRFPEFFRHHPAMRGRILAVSPATFRTALFSAAGSSLLTKTANNLFVTRPELSARLVTNAWQSLALGLLVGTLPVVLFFWTQAFIVGLHLAASLFFFLCILLRVMPIRSAGTRMPPLSRSRPGGVWPVYTVMVALYREQNMVGDLLVNLSRLNWPRSRIEIKLVCECDDQQTIDAIRGHALAGCVEVVIVPPGGPRTKPNALSFALQASHGEFVVIYDAEDRPHPDQLLEAWSAFAAGDPSLACLQAPLVIDNGHINRMTGMFAIEYAGLFRGLLPWLARHGLPLPLGGTSNHFRRSALESVCAWDPYNVTEDADLAIRLYRAGFRCGTLTRPTFEEAPEEFRTWLGQRTRWFKGWMQCWLVHNRSVFILYNELKLKKFLVSQILLIGIILSILIHPASYLLILYGIAELIASGQASDIGLAVMVLDATNVMLAYGSFFLLGARSVTNSERSSIRAGFLYVPVYWMMLSLAGWRAVIELARKPHHWEKTAHKPAARLRGKRSVNLK